jgi:hypothetical protein
VPIGWHPAVAAAAAGFDVRGSMMLPPTASWRWPDDRDDLIPAPEIRGNRLGNIAAGTDCHSQWDAGAEHEDDATKTAAAAKEVEPFVRQSVHRLLSSYSSSFPHRHRRIGPK